MRVRKVIIKPEHHQLHNLPHVATAGLECDLVDRWETPSQTLAFAIFENTAYQVTLSKEGDWVSRDTGMPFNLVKEVTGEDHE